MHIYRAADVIFLAEDITDLCFVGSGDWSLLHLISVHDVGIPIILLWGFMFSLYVSVGVFKYVTNYVVSPLLVSLIKKVLILSFPL